MASNLPAAAEIKEELLPPGDAYALLSKPTLDLTEADMVKIAQDLRAKRVRFLAGKADKPPAKPKAGAVDTSAEAKAARTAHLAEQLKLTGLKI